MPRPTPSWRAFEKAMDDDFNTADALAAVFELVKFINTNADENSSREYLQNLLDRLRSSDGCAGPDRG